MGKGTFEHHQPCAGMPTYRFSLPEIPDPEPLDFDDDDAVWSEAVVLCREMLRDINGNLPTNKEWTLAVTDEAGQLVASLRVLATRRPRDE